MKRIGSRSCNHAPKCKTSKSLTYLPLPNSNYINQLEVPPSLTLGSLSILR